MQNPNIRLRQIWWEENVSKKLKINQRQTKRIQSGSDKKRWKLMHSIIEMYREQTGQSNAIHCWSNYIGSAATGSSEVRIKAMMGNMKKFNFFLCKIFFSLQSISLFKVHSRQSERRVYFLNFHHFCHATFWKVYVNDSFRFPRSKLFA